MRLTDLEPRWIHENVFVFRCPHCQAKTPGQGLWLSCKNAPMGNSEQIEVLQAADLDPTGPRYGSVPTRADFAWQISGRDFAMLTVAPSIDASAAGHWHGFIRNGEVIDA